jgi:hypothetical protein
MLRGAAAKANERSGCARRPAAMHAQHHNDGLVETFGGDVWMTDTQDQTRSSIGEDKPGKGAPLSIVESIRTNDGTTHSAVAEVIVFDNKLASG